METTIPCPVIDGHEAFIQATTPGAKEIEQAEHALLYCPECNQWYLVVYGGVHENQAYRVTLSRLIPLHTEAEQLVDDEFAKRSPIYRPTH